MRTAGKRPKALPARRIRPRDSRFVPTLTDRPQPAPWPAPSASLPARKHAACGDFQEPLSASPDRCLRKKFFFSRSAGCPVAARFSPVLFPQGRHIRHCCLHSFPLCLSRRRQPLRTVLPPACPPLIKGWTCPHPIQATVFPPHKKLLPMAGLPQPLLRSSSTQPHPSRHPNRRPRRTRAPHAPRELAAVVDSKGETPGDPRPRGARRPHAPPSLTGTKVFAGMGARGKGSLFQKAALPPNGPGSCPQTNQEAPSSSPGHLPCSPLPSGPRLGKDAANKRRWRD